MTENVENLVLEMLRGIRGDIAGLKEDVRQLGVQMSAIRHHVRGTELTVDTNTDAIASMKLRLDRIERRLELSDAT